MRCSIVFLAILALGAAIPPPVQKQRAADQSLLAKQQDIIALLNCVTEDIPNEQLSNLGHTYDIEANAQQYDNPIIVQYYAGAVKNGLAQPKGTVYSNSNGQLRKEVALLVKILLGAKNYQTFLATAAWARVHVNENQFVKAFTVAVLQRQDTQGVILPPPYEIFPNLYFDSRIIQEVQQIVNQQGSYGVGQQQHQQLQQQQVVIPINYTAHLPHGEHALSYFTNDIGLQTWYSYIQLAGYILPQHGATEQQAGQQNGHGALNYYLHQQLLAHYQLNRYSQGLGQVDEVDFENVEVPYNPHIRYTNGLEAPSRPEVLPLQQTNPQLVQLVKKLEQRLMEAIESGHVLTPQGTFLSLYQPQGLNILADLIQGTGRSINPRYYGSLMNAARQLLGNGPEVQNIYDYTPSVLELGHTAVADPVFYQLCQRVMNLFQQWQESLPAYQYNDLVLPGVNVQKVDFSKLVTFFTDYYVNLDNAAIHPGSGAQQQQQQQQQTPNIQGLVKRLDHKPYTYQIVVQSEKNIPNAVVRVYLGPKFNHEGQPISISEHRQQFVELDQFVHDLQQGQNVIVRNSQQATSQSHDWPSVQNIKHHVNAAIRSQEPLYITEPQQIYGFPARLSLPKGRASGLPLQTLVVISQPGQQNVQWGPVIPQQYQTYQSQHYQVVGIDDYTQAQGKKGITGIPQTVDVLPVYEDVQTQQEALQIQTHGANWYVNQYGTYPWNALYGQQFATSGAQQKLHQGQQYQYGQQQVGYGQHLHGQQYSSTGAGSVGSVGGYGYGAYPGYGMHGAGAAIQAGVAGQSGIAGQTGIGGQAGVGAQGGMGGQQPGVGGQAGISGRVGYGGVAGGYGAGGVAGHGDVPQGQQIMSSGQQHWGGFQGVYPAAKPDVTVSEYYSSKHISEVIGGGVSLDGKPFGYPLDRPLGLSALYVPNIHIEDVYVYHEDEPVGEQISL